jgi:hypothetical protein
MNTTNAFINFSQHTSGLNHTGVEVPVNDAYQFNNGSLLNENSIVDQAALMPCGNNDILYWNEVLMPGFSYGQGHQDQFIFSDSIMALSDNFLHVDATPNMMAFPPAANVPAGPVAAIQEPPAAIQPASSQHAQYTLCTCTFGRTSDLTRHMTSIHHIRPQVLYLYPVLGCPKSFGTDYSRQDKVTEHLRKIYRSL